MGRVNVPLDLFLLEKLLLVVTLLRFGLHRLLENRLVASVGEPPQRVGISEWDNMEKVQAYLKSAERKKVVDGNKAVKITRQYVVETSK